MLHAERMRALGAPLIVVMNHASWWDPLVALAVSRALLPRRVHYAPMDEVALRQYGFFKRLGLFPIAMRSPRGAAEFMRGGAEVLRDARNVLWVTAQGEFADVRMRPAGLKMGVGALVHAMERCVVLPVAIEYPFWDEKLPEALINFGEAIVVERGAERSAEEWTKVFDSGLVGVQDELAIAAMRRDAAEFETLIAGGAGVGGVYEAWQRWRARMRGEKFESEHGRIGRQR